MSSGRIRTTSNFSFYVGVLVSLTGHLFFAFVALIFFENSAATAVKTEVFSVTLEGGMQLGGYAQAPKDDKPRKAPKEQADAPEPESSEAEQATKATPPEETKKLETPSAVEDVEKKAEEARLKAEAEKEKKIAIEKEKKAEEQKKKADEEKKKAEDEKRKAEEKQEQEEEDARKKAEAEKQAKKDKDKEFDKRLSQIRRGITQRYDGESANAGGKGIGAARVGGQGMGGGTLISVEKLAFLNALEAHVKSGWHWIMASDRLTATVRFQILPNGEVQNVRLEQGSGNSNFDESAIRAVRKASPVPVPPAKFYDELSDVRIIFDSKQ